MKPRCKSLLTPHSVRPLSAEQLSGQCEKHLVTHQTHRLHYAMQPAFSALQNAANLAGFDCQIASAFRSFAQQQIIWDNKYNGLRPILDNNSQPIDINTLTELEKVSAIMRWSALPGASRHHWGTEIDIYAKNCLPKDVSLRLEPWEYQTGHQQDFCHWLDENIAQYGFYRPYAEDRGGVAVEPWHLSYYPISQQLQSDLTLAHLCNTITNSSIAGKAQILEHLDTLYKRFITNVCEV